MKRMILASAVLVALASPVLAGGAGDYHPGMKANDLNRVYAGASAVATSSSSSTVNLVGNAGAGAGAGGAGGGDRGRGGDYGAGAIGLGGLSSGLCSGVSGGLVVQTPVVGVGLQTGTINRGCELRYDSIREQELGDVELAKAIMDLSPNVQEAKRNLGRGR